MHEIIINKIEGKEQILLVDDGKLVEFYENNEERESIEGNIYLGKVQNVLQGMQAAFIDIGANKNTFIHLKDILPKVDEKIETKREEPKMKEIVKQGMPLLVQVKRDSTDKKGARVSTHVSLTGKYLVYMPDANFITISQKIDDIKERERLIKLVQKLLPVGSGAIIRTSAVNKKEEQIKKDINIQQDKWEQIIKASNEKQENKEFPQLIYKNDSIVKKIFIDLIEKNIAKVIVNNKQTHSRIKEMLEVLEIKDVQIELKKDVLNMYTLNKEIAKLQNRRIWLKSGGFISIDKTEALTAIDVNSGKYVGTKDLEQTAYIVNKEATVEIAKQLRLRDIGGIVIIDYIDMHKKENQTKIQNLLEEELKKDRSKTQIIGLTKLNLMEMTRKHICGNE